MGKGITKPKRSAPPAPFLKPTPPPVKKLKPLSERIDDLNAALLESDMTRRAARKLLKLLCHFPAYYVPSINYPDASEMEHELKTLKRDVIMDGIQRLEEAYAFVMHPYKHIYSTRTDGTDIIQCWNRGKCAEVLRSVGLPPMPPLPEQLRTFPNLYLVNKQIYLVPFPTTSPQTFTPDCALYLSNTRTQS